MNKTLWLSIICVGHIMGVQHAGTIEKQAVSCAGVVMGSQVEKKNKQRLLVAGALGILGVAGVASWARWLKAGFADSTCVCKGAAVVKGSVENETVGSLVSLGNFVKSGAASVAQMAVGGACLNFIAPYITEVTNRATRFYQPLSWSILVRDHVKLPSLLKQLKYSAVSLDPQSRLFDSLRNVSIQWQGAVALHDDEGYISTHVFDELVHMKMLSSAGTPVKGSSGAFINVWNELVRALTFCVGYIEYKTENTLSDNSFDLQQLASFKREAVERTNELAHFIEHALLQDYPEGLLSAIYDYCAYVHHLALSLEINDIVEG